MTQRLLSQYAPPFLINALELNKSETTMMANFFFIATILCLGLLLYGLFKPGKMLVWVEGTRDKVAKFYGAAAFCLFLGFIYVLPKPSPPEAVGAAGVPVSGRSEDALTVSSGFNFERLASQVNGIDPDLSLTKLSKVAGDRYVIEVGYSPKSIWSSSAYVHLAGSNMLKVGRVLKEAGVPVSSIVFSASAKGVDKYGGEGIGKAMVLTLSAEDFERVSWENIGPPEFLNLLGVDFSKMGKSAAIDYCDDEKWSQRASVFCDAAKGAT